MHQSPFRRLACGALVCALAVLAACADQQPVAPPAPTAQGDLAAQVAALGFHPDMIVDEGDYFRVEGDIIISKRDLAGPSFQRTPTGGPSFQWQTAYLVDQYQMSRGIKVDLRGISTSSVWMNAARNAIQSWNSTYGSMVYLSEGTPAQITLRFGSLPASTFAQADFPAGGQPGRTITINNPTLPINGGQKHWIMVHEFGHTLGLRHTNMIELGEGGLAYHIPGTPQDNDNASVFRGGLSSVPYWSAFSTYDQKAYKYLYPAGTPTFTFQGYEANHPKMQWTHDGWANYFRVTTTYYYWRYIPYDPQVSSDGYWGWEAYPQGSVNVSGSWPYVYTDPYATPDTTGECYAEYYVQPVYVSGKNAPSVMTTFAAC